MSSPIPTWSAPGIRLRTRTVSGPRYPDAGGVRRGHRRRTGGPGRLAGPPTALAPSWRRTSRSPGSRTQTNVPSCSCTVTDAEEGTRRTLSHEATVTDIYAAYQRHLHTQIDRLVTDGRFAMLIGVGDRPTITIQDEVRRLLAPARTPPFPAGQWQACTSSPSAGCRRAARARPASTCANPPRARPPQDRLPDRGRRRPGAASQTRTGCRRCPGRTDRGRPRSVLPGPPLPRPHQRRVVARLDSAVRARAECSDPAHRRLPGRLGSRSRAAWNCGCPDVADRDRVKSSQGRRQDRLHRPRGHQQRRAAPVLERRLDRPRPGPPMARHQPNTMPGQRPAACPSTWSPTSPRSSTA